MFRLNLRSGKCRFLESTKYFGGNFSLYYGAPIDAFALLASVVVVLIHEFPLSITIFFLKGPASYASV